MACPPFVVLRAEGAQYPTFVLTLSFCSCSPEMTVEFVFVFSVFWGEGSPNCTCMLLFSVSYSFFVFCRVQHSSTAAKCLSPRPVLPRKK